MLPPGKKTIIVVGPTPPPYHGISVFTNSILKSDLGKQFHVIHVDISDRRGISNIGKFDLINIFLSIKHGLHFLFSIFKYRPQLVYLPISENTAGFLRDCFFILPSILMNKKLLIHVHGAYFLPFYKNSNILLQLLIKFIFKQVFCCVVLCKYFKYKFRALLPEKKIVIIPYGIDDIEVNSIEKKSVKSSYNIIYLSNLIKEKGFLDVLSAAPHVLSVRKDVRFVFAGAWKNGEDKKKAEEIIQRYNLEANVDFVGIVQGQKKNELLSMSDIFVFPTYYRHESFGIVNLEAMSASLPIITTNKACIRNLISDGENGYLVDEQSPQQIAEKIITLLEDPTLRMKMGENGRKRFLQYYTKERMIENLYQIFMRS